MIALHLIRNSPREMRRLGYDLGIGVIAAAAWITLLGLIGAWAINLMWPNRRDDTDTAFGARSGVILRTDYGTGCQYLESRAGALTPRLDREGRQICGSPR